MAGIVSGCASAIGAAAGDDGGDAGAAPVADDSAWGVTASGSAVPSNTDARLADATARNSALVRNRIAVMVVMRARGLLALPEPNIGELAPPNAAPMSAPRPAWSSTTRISTMQAII